MMNCKKACSLHTASRDGALGGRERFFYDLHMRICPGCKNFRAQLDTTVSALQAVGRTLDADVEPTDDLIEALARALPSKADDEG